MSILFTILLIRREEFKEDAYDKFSDSDDPNLQTMYDSRDYLLSWLKNSQITVGILEMIIFMVIVWRGTSYNKFYRKSNWVAVCIVAASSILIHVSSIALALNIKVYIPKKNFDFNFLGNEFMYSGLYLLLVN